MLLTIPILATEQKQANDSAPTVSVRPLFNLNTFEQGKSLQRAVNKLTQTLRNQFEIHGKKARHYDLAWFTFSPLLSSKILSFRLFLASKSFDCKYLFVVFDAFGKKLAFTPNVPGIWFEIGARRRSANSCGGSFDRAFPRTRTKGRKKFSKIPKSLISLAKRLLRR